MKKLLLALGCLLLVTQPAEAGIGKKLKRVTKYGIAVAIIPARIFDGIWGGVFYGVDLSKRDFYRASAEYECEQETFEEIGKRILKHLEVPATVEKKPVTFTEL